jgi:hypothetical protein
MHATPPVPETDKQADLRRLEAALAADRLDPRPSISNEVMQEKTAKKLKALEAKVLADVGSLDAEKAEFFYKSAAVAQARRDPEPGIADEAVRDGMEGMIAELDQEIFALPGG